MKVFILFLGIIIASVKAMTITEEYRNGLRYSFTTSTYPQGSTHYKGTFDNIYTVETGTLNSSFMEFQITAATAGWVGIILNPTNPTLAGGDVLIAGIHDDSGEPYYTDMYGALNATLMVDSKPDSDWILVSATQTSTSRPETKFVFHRRYKTDDENIDQDCAIPREESVHLLAIMGQEDNPHPIFAPTDRLGTTQVYFMVDGTGDEGPGSGGRACGLSGSLTLILTLVLIFMLQTV